MGHFPWSHPRIPCLVSPGVGEIRMSTSKILSFYWNFQLVQITSYSSVHLYRISRPSFPIQLTNNHIGLQLMDFSKWYWIFVSKWCSLVVGKWRSLVVGKRHCLVLHCGVIKLRLESSFGKDSAVTQVLADLAPSSSTQPECNGHRRAKQKEETSDCNSCTGSSTQN